MLSEMPARFSTAIHRWARMNNIFRTPRAGASAMPDRNTEYLYYQTLIGAWPISVERAQAYMLKATREAKQQTTWTANNKEFEDAMNKFIEGTLNHQPFVKELEQFLDKIILPGRVNSLAQTLLKYTAPGVPDTYQGTEIWDLSLVDPDNRRPVDYDLRRRLLDDLKRLDGTNVASEVMARIDEGMPKMWVVHQALLLRRERPDWFGAQAGYTPLPAEGSRSEHLIAYLRGDSLAVVVPRLSVKLGGTWRETSVSLPPGRWMNRLTNAEIEGGRVAIKSLLESFPVALLVKKDQVQGGRNA